MDKKHLQILVNTLFGLLLIAYGYIFGSVIDRINKVEQKIEAFTTPISQMNESLVEIKNDVKWLKQIIK
jgi:uncharacterized protein (UPF0335 family)